MTTQESGPADEKDPRLDDVVESVTATRDDVDDTEVRDRAERVLDDLSGAEVQAFVTPLATNQVRKEVIAEHGTGGEASGTVAGGGTTDEGQGEDTVDEG